MPRLSNKEIQRREVFNLYLISLRRRDRRYSKTRKWLAIHEAFMKERYMEPRIAISKFDWASHILPQYADARWRTFARMNPESFQHIVRLISNNPVFHNNSMGTCWPILKVLWYPFIVPLTELFDHNLYVLLDPFNCGSARSLRLAELRSASNVVRDRLRALFSCHWGD